MLDINDFLDLQLTFIILVPVEDVGAQRRPDKTVGAVRVMMETGFQRDQAFGTKVNGFLDCAIFEIPEMDVLAVFAIGNILKIKARHECIRGRPFG